jgi:hypothetical protein
MQEDIDDSGSEYEPTARDFQDLPTEEPQTPLAIRLPT